jgi:hypothetical protein
MDRLKLHLRNLAENYWESPEDRAECLEVLACFLAVVVLIIITAVILFGV